MEAGFGPAPPTGHAPFYSPPPPGYEAATAFQPPPPPPVDLGEGQAAALSLHGPTQGVTMDDQNTGSQKVLPSQIGVAHIDTAQPPLQVQFAQTPYAQASPLLWAQVQAGPGSIVPPAATKGTQPYFHQQYVPAVPLSSETPHYSPPPGAHEHYPHVQTASPARTDTHGSWMQQVHQNAFNILKYGQTFGTWTLKHEREHAQLEKRLAALEAGGTGDGVVHCGQEAVRGANGDVKNGPGGTSSGNLRGGLQNASSPCLNCGYSACSSATGTPTGGDGITDARNDITRTRLGQQLDELAARVYKLESNRHVQGNNATGTYTNPISRPDHMNITITSEQDRQICQNTHEILQQRHEIAELKRQVNLLTDLVHRNDQAERGEPNAKRAKTSRVGNPCSGYE